VNFRGALRDEVEINLTPLIDVVFLLLIFFMVSTTFEKESELKVQLPEASVEPTQLPEQPIEVVIDVSGGYFIDGRALVNTETTTLRAALQKRAGGNVDTPIVIRGDAKTPYQAVITAMDAAAQLGLVNLSMATVLPSE
jgi:biopolymer transport protein ExbD